MSSAETTGAANCSATGWRELWRRVWSRAQRLRLERRPRHLRLCETVGLGEKRFVALVECDRQRFLIGGTSTGLVLLHRMAADGSSRPAGEGEEE